MSVVLSPHLSEEDREYWRERACSVDFAEHTPTEEAEVCEHPASAEAWEHLAQRAEYRSRALWSAHWARVLAGSTA
jgi:hypothetical protein